MKKVICVFIVKLFFKCFMLFLFFFGSKINKYLNFFLFFFKGENKKTTSYSSWVSKEYMFFFLKKHVLKHKK